jgi:hypothetical protein
MGLSDFFSLGPFALDGVEVKRVWWQVKERVSFLFDGLFHLCAFVESYIVHQSHASRWEFGKKILAGPGRKDLDMDVGLEQTDCQQRFAKQGAPIVFSETSLPAKRIAVGSG